MYIIGLDVRARDQGVFRERENSPSRATQKYKYDFQALFETRITYKMREPIKAAILIKRGLSRMFFWDIVFHPRSLALKRR